MSWLVKSLLSRPLSPAVPPRVVSRSQVKSMYGNEPATFTVSYLSTLSNTTITWLLNNSPLPPDRGVITTQTINETAGETSLEFDQLTRADKGRYTVVLHNNNQLLIPVNRSIIYVNFVVDVNGMLNKFVLMFTISISVSFAVPPSQPSLPVITPFENKTLSRITWNLTNQTADAGPDYLVVMIEDHPSSSRLDPSTKELLIRTEPGVSYFVTVTAYNSDSFTKSQRAGFTLGPEGKFLPRKLNDHNESTSCGVHCVGYLCLYSSCNCLPFAFNIIIALPISHSLL